MERKVQLKSEFLIGCAVSSLGEFMQNRDRDNCEHHVQKAIKNLVEFLGDNTPCPELSDDQAALSASLHSWLRKFEDSDVSCILYQMISNSMATTTWYTFVKAVHKIDVTKMKNDAMLTREINHALSQAEHISDTLDMNNRIFYNALSIWCKDGGMASALRQIDEWNKE